MKGTMEKISNSENNSAAWDMSDAPEFNGDLKAELHEPDIIEDVKFWSQEYNTTELQFARYAKNLNLRSLDTESYSRYRDTVSKYEGDIAYNWEHLNNATNAAQSNQLLRKQIEVADTQGLGIVDPAETVEAATGIFYDERMQILNQKILSSAPDETTMADQTILRQTWRRVMDYIEASTDYDFLHRDYTAYQNARRNCHNNMIEQLNNLNRLAEKYNTTRFTPRNFMTNDFEYNQRRDRSGRLNHRANYDRETVLAYFRTVFERDFSSMEAKAAYNSRDLRAGMSYYD